MDVIATGIKARCIPVIHRKLATSKVNASATHPAFAKIVCNTTANPCPKIAPAGPVTINAIGVINKTINNGLNKCTTTSGNILSINFSIYDITHTVRIIGTTVPL